MKVTLKQEINDALRRVNDQMPQKKELYINKAVEKRYGRQSLIENARGQVLVFESDQVKTVAGTDHSYGVAYQESPK